MQHVYIPSTLSPSLPSLPSPPYLRAQLLLHHIHKVLIVVYPPFSTFKQTTPVIISLIPTSRPPLLPADGMVMLSLLLLLLFLLAPPHHHPHLYPCPHCCCCCSSSRSQENS